MRNTITSHPILNIEKKPTINFYYNGKLLSAYIGMPISSALFYNRIRAFGKHQRNSSPQGLFCANGQCSECKIMANQIPVKACMTPIEDGMKLESIDGLPEIPEFDTVPEFHEIEIVKTKILIIGGGPAGLSAAEILSHYGLPIILIDDKSELGGKLILQTHKFFGNTDVYAGMRGIDISKELTKKIEASENIDIWLDTQAVAVFSDKLIGVVKDKNNYTLIEPEIVIIATGAREKMLSFEGNTLPGVMGAGAFQTLLNRDLVKPGEKVFIVGGGNVGLIAGYHALQADIEVIGLVEALPECGGYKVHEDKLRRSGVPIFTGHSIVSANGTDSVESITIAELDKDWNIIDGTEMTFECDTILIAVGLDPINELYTKAADFGINTYISGDADQIAEASAAIYSGKKIAIEVLDGLGYSIHEDRKIVQKNLDILRSKTPAPEIRDHNIEFDSTIRPIFHCDQSIPCNPCASVCPQDQIKMEEDTLTGRPYFVDDDRCIGCGKCVAICPGLAITIVDSRKDVHYPEVTLAYEYGNNLKIGEYIELTSNKHPIGKYPITRIRELKMALGTKLITVKMPRAVASIANGFKIQTPHSPIDAESTDGNEKIVCRCERVSEDEIRTWIKASVRDINQLKALTRVGMGSCGGNTCKNLLLSIFKQEGVASDEIIEGTERPIEFETPLGYFAGEEDDK